MTKNISEDSAESMHRLYHKLNNELRAYQEANRIRSTMALVLSGFSVIMWVVHMVQIYIRDL